MWQGEDKSSAPTLWVRLDTSSVGFASGVAFTPAIRDRWRAAVGSDDGAELDEAIGTVLREHAAGAPEVAGEQLKTVPKPWAADHPRADLLRLSGFQLRFAEPTPACITEPEFVPWCEARLRDLLPIHRWLVEHVSSEALTE